MKQEGFGNPYLEDRRPSSGEAEQLTGNMLVTLFRFFRVSMPLEGDVRAVHRTGELLRRWGRRFLI